MKNKHLEFPIRFSTDKVVPEDAGKKVKMLLALRQETIEGDIKIPLTRNPLLLNGTHNEKCVFVVVIVNGNEMYEGLNGEVDERNAFFAKVCFRARLQLSHNIVSNKI